MIPLQNLLPVNEASELTLQKSSLSRPSARKLAVLLRMDEHIDLLVFADVEAHSRFIPNVGVRIADALGALIGSGELLQTTDILVIHHTAYDKLPSRKEDRLTELKQDLSADATCLHFRALERLVQDDVAFLRASPLILKHTKITGLIYAMSTDNFFPVTYC